MHPRMNSRNNETYIFGHTHLFWVEKKRSTLYKNSVKMYTL
jgi:predicted phosphodiesterase